MIHRNYSVKAGACWLLGNMDWHAVRVRSISVRCSSLLPLHFLPWFPLILKINCLRRCLVFVKFYCILKMEEQRTKSRILHEHTRDLVSKLFIMRVRSAERRSCVLHWQVCRRHCWRMWYPTERSGNIATPWLCLYLWYGTHFSVWILRKFVYFSIFSSS